MKRINKEDVKALLIIIGLPVAIVLLSWLQADDSKAQDQQDADYCLKVSQSVQTIKRSARLACL